jgi:hypothetical protein
MRLAPVSALTGALLDFSASDDCPTTGFGASGTSSQFTAGAMIEAAPTDGVDTGTNVPNWGLCKLMYVYNSSTAIVPGKPVVVDKNFNIVELPTTGNTGRPVYITLTNFAAGSTTRQGGWVLVSGVAPVTFSVAATVGPVGGGTAGNFTPTLAAGRQILNATTLIAAASAFTRQITTQNGSPRVRVPRVNGMFPGLTISGTGVSGTILSIDPGGNFITLSANATATGTVTGTFTPTGYGIVHLNNAFVQGQIS